MCGRKRIRCEEQAVEDKEKENADFSKGSVYIYIYICRIYSAKVAMSSRPIGFHGTRCNKRLVVSFVRALPERGGPIFSRGICPVSGTEERYASRPLFGGDHVESTGRTDFDRPIDSYAEIRKCLHASSGYNYFAPKFLMKYVR